MDISKAPPLKRVKILKLRCTFQPTAPLYSYGYGYDCEPQCGTYVSWGHYLIMPELGVN